MSSIVLQPGVKDMLLADCKDFLCSEEWYVIILASCLILIISSHLIFAPGMRKEVYLLLALNCIMSPDALRQRNPVQERLPSSWRTRKVCQNSAYLTPVTWSNIPFLMAAARPHLSIPWPESLGWTSMSFLCHLKGMSDAFISFIFD